MDKTKNVRIIDEIFGRAKTVLVWLGPESDYSDEAMDFFPAMIDVFSGVLSRQEIAHPELPSERNAAYRIPKMVALNNLLSRDWFRRLWIVQEGAFATLVVGLKPRGTGSGLGEMLIKAEYGVLRDSFDAFDAFLQRPNEVRMVLDAFQDVGKARRFFVTANRCYMGLAPSVVSKGDICKMSGFLLSTSPAA